ncbi:hypothetical protein MPSI1_001162 [Malassezia psittaci]|uniref:FAS1 domain-containing protein n=1 Tax=Malassezia psittaci TaxID=1821823 RepID=A0AAF0FD27_9BASI|nr:hypothetical protein MPSI1_001162 [Malassezia psittaci]
MSLGPTPGMKRVVWVLLLSLCYFVAYACAEPRNLVDAIAARADLTRFVHLLQRTRLIPTLNRMQELDYERTGVTLFAPSNAAFERVMKSDTDEGAFWREAFSERIPDNIHSALRQRLWYHVLNYTLQDAKEPLTYHETMHYPSRKRLQESTRPGPIPQPPIEPPHPGAEDTGGLLGGAGQLLRVYRKSNVFRIGTDTKGAGGVKVIDQDLSSTHGIVCVLDGILTLPPSLTELLQTNQQVSRLFAMLPNETLHTLSITAHLTMFLPSNEALSRLSDLEQKYIFGRWADVDYDRLQLFAWHVSSIGLGHGRIGYTEQIRDVEEYNLTTIMGGELALRVLDNGQINVNGSKVVQENLLTENGVVHIVDDVHLPFGDLGMTIEKYLLVLGAGRFVCLLHHVGLSHYIDQAPHEPGEDGSEPPCYTLLAPSDEALDQWLEQQYKGYAPFSIQYAKRDQHNESYMQELRELLLYHILPGLNFLDTIADGELLSTELRTAKLGNAQQPVLVTQSKTSSYQLPVLNGIPLQNKPTVTSNSHIYLTDTILPVPGNVLQTIQEHSHSVDVFSKALTKMPLKEVVQAPSRSYLVPVDPAFRYLGLVSTWLLLPTKASRADLKTMVDHHSFGKILYRGDFASNWTKYQTCAKESLLISRDKDSLLVRQSNVSEEASTIMTDLLTETGTVHLLNTILLPPSLEIGMEKLMVAANASIMIRLVRQAGYDWVFKTQQANASTQTTKCAEKMVLLVPNDAAFASLNITKYEEDQDLLRALILQHILVINPCKKKKTQQLPFQLPLTLKDGVIHTSMLDESRGGSSSYGAVAFRRVAKPSNESLGYMVGVKGSRKTSNARHAARLLDFGSIQLAAEHTASSAGILALDAVLEPYQTGWFSQWGWTLLTALLGTCTLGTLGFYGYRNMLSRGYRRIPAALEGEEE